MYNTPFPFVASMIFATFTQSQSDTPTSKLSGTERMMDSGTTSHYCIFKGIIMQQQSLSIPKTFYCDI